MISSLCTLNFKEYIIPPILLLISKWDKLFSLRYFLLKYIRSSTKLAALEMTYWRNDLLFCIIDLLFFQLWHFQLVFIWCKIQNNLQSLIISDYTGIFTSRIFKLALEITFLTSTFNCVFLLTFLRIWKLQRNNW